MKALSWMRSRPKTLASTAVVIAGAVTITTLALNYDGNPTAEVDLNDGGVWITKSSSLMVGHFNYQSTVLDGGLRTTAESFDVLQDESTIVVVNEDDSTATVVDPARVALDESTAIPGAGKVALGENTTAILDEASGDLWVVPVQRLTGFEFAGTDPTLELGENADATVGSDGTVHAISPADSAIYSIPVDSQGDPLDPRKTDIEGIDESSTPTITAVGDRPVALVPDEGVVVSTAGFRADVPEADTAVLQQPSPTGEDVVLATSSSLVSLPFDGSEPQTISSGGQGVPAAPVALLGCDYGAWAGSAKFVRQCAGTAEPFVEDIPELSPTAELAFRVNRDVIVLNDVIAGSAWLATESLQQVDNWNDITPPEGDTEEEEKTTEETVETSLPERSEDNTDPVAEDDAFGVRPGGTTLLSILDNDTDADGDVLVAEVISNQPSIGEVQPINNGSALQIAVPEDASGSATFEYQIDDGRDGTDTARVVLNVHDWSQNGAPTLKRTPTLAVEVGGTISYNVLPDWQDPDGDDVYLKEIVPAPGDEVDVTTDGQMTYRAVASAPGRYEVQMIVADASGESASGILQLDVRPTGSTLPKTNADHVVTRVGEQVTVAPLTNDSSSSREPLRLSNVEDVEGATVVPDYPNKTFTFSAASSGTYYVQYLVNAGVPSAAGIVRVDVQEEDPSDLAPVAVRDVALLPTGGEVLVGVLNNDTDPGGGILVVQSVSVEPGSGISVSVLNHESLRISDQGGIDDQVRITYRISNGTQSAEGDVVVIPIPASDKLLPPIADDDTAKVRVGDVVTIPVLDNDSHPNDLPMHVAPELIEPFIDPEDGEAFVSQDAIRFRAGPEAKTVYATYEVVDENGQKDAGYVTIQILPLDDENNAAPRPRDVTVRTIAGSVANIAIPLDGIDADGDSVELLGLDAAPKQGRVTEVGPNYLVYQAFADASGVDTFTYKVRDNLGKEATATVHVGIAPGEGTNQAPYAVKDSVVVRPGREVAVPALANDSDPEGDEIFLVENGVTFPDDVAGLDARVSGDRVLIQAPEEELETSVRYRIVDERGADASAIVQVTIDEDVPLLFPIARDDRVTSEDIEDAETVDVEVLANDEDPDGTTDSLELTSDAGGEVLENRKIRVAVTEERQLIRYTIADEDGQETSAFIFVPAHEELLPTLTSTEPIEVVSGETIEVPLADYVTVAGGGSVVLTVAEKVSAAHSNGSDLIKDERTLVYTSAEGYFGDDALNFEVTDGTGPDDPEGRVATLAIPITVLPPANQQPTFTRGEMNVAPGEEASSIDLAGLTEDPDLEDRGQHTFEYVRGATDGLDARVEGTRLSVSATPSTPKGTTASIVVRVSDGETEPIEGTVDVTVTASTRDLPVANTDTYPESDQGETITVPVLANDVNPFEGEGPLTLISAVPESGQGTAEVVGDQVEVTPDADYVGVMTVRYRIGDITEDPDRAVDGLIELTVQGVPDAPGMPTVSSVQDRTVVLSWTPPANNGAEITGYTVRSVQGDAYTKQCQSTTCTLDGLTNNVKYLFQVTATNRVGESDPSPSSAEARPDARPDTPAAPKLTFGDQELKIDWTTPTTPGSPVQYYTLELSGGTGAGTKTNITGNSYVWQGLENGSSYTVRVRAHNLAPDPSSWSEYSLPEVPAGPPAAPSKPTTSELGAVGDRRQMQITWVAPDDNGDAIAGYELVIHNGSNTQTVAIGSAKTSYTATVDTSTTAYTYTVRAQNKAGWGDYSPASDPRRAVLNPAAPAKPRIDVVGDHRFTVVKSSYQLTAAQLNGATASETTYQYNIGSGWVGNWDGTTISGLTNGTSYTVRVRAVATVDGQQYISGDSAASDAAVPFGKPPAPGATATSQAKNVKFTWSYTGDNGAPITTQIRIDGGGWQTVANSGTRTSADGYSTKHTIDVRTHNKAGYSAVTTKSATSGKAPPPPKPEAWLSAGATVSGCTVSGGGTCHRYTLTTNQYFKAGYYHYECWAGGKYSSNNAGYSRYFPSGGSVDLGCYSGYYKDKSVKIIGGDPAWAYGNFG